MSLKAYIPVGLVIVMGVSGPAQAWETEIQQDPISDSLTAVLAPTLKRSDLNVMFRCWSNHPEETLIGVGNLEHFDTAANYPWVFEGQFRIDKGNVHDLPMTPENAGGYLGSRVNAAADSQVFEILNELISAQERFVVRFEGQTKTYDVSGISSKVEQFVVACGLDLANQQ